ncbi:dynein axonemal heavy chain 17-like isoform X1 [Scomber scombrus]|uniref:Dynein axonemal heavy chain 17-like isoform X1 n=1 Tax=Scomber scombrus TaxID=13677 RepID=A0AAV1QE02_SCOSC
MESRDPRMESLCSFTLRSFRLEPQTWREFVSEEEKLLLFTSFFTCPDSLHLFIYRDAEAQLSVSLSFPADICSKLICVSKAGREAVTMETKPNFIIQEVQGDDPLSFLSAITEQVSFLSAITEQVTCPLLSNPENSQGWAAGVAEEALRFMERQKNEAQVMKAQVDGRTFLPQPDALHDDHHQDNGIQEDSAERKLLDVKLVHACESTAIEWAELVSDFLQQDSSQPLLDGLKPPPSCEVEFWRNRLRNLQFIQQQLMSSRAQQVASILKTADSVYSCTLTEIFTHVQQGLMEAEDVTHNLEPLQEKLAEVEQLEYQQLRDNMVAVMEEVRLVWIRSQFYRKPCRIVVLLQEICNLFIHLSREFLRGEEVMRGLVADPGPVLDDVRLVIVTLQTLKEAYSQCRTQLDHHQEAHCVSLQLYQLHQTLLSGVSGRMWSDVVQDVYQDFLGHVAVLSDCSCDATDPEDQSFQPHLDQFRAQVWDLERRLVSVLSRALQDCCASSSAAKLLQMFGFILERPLNQEQLRPHLSRLLEVVLTELDQTRLLVSSQREKADTFCRFTPSPAAVLCWTQQLQLRAQQALKNYKAAQHLCVDSGELQVVVQRFQQIVDLLQDFRDTVRSDWNVQLDSDSDFILEQPLIQHDQQGMLGVSSSQKLEVLQRELRYVSRETHMTLRPQAARLLTCRDDITHTYLNLSHMVSSYNQVVSGVLQVELPLIQDQLQDLDQSLLELQRNTWSSEGLQQLVEQQRQKVLMFCTTVMKARANMDTITDIIQGWVEELHLLQRSGDSLLEGGATEQSYSRLREEGQELLRLTQENQSLYGAQDSSQAWITYLDHIDDKVQDGLFQLLHRSLHFLCDSMNPQLQETGSAFEPSVGGGLSDLMKSVISDVYTAASLLPRISVSRHGNYQVSLQQSPDLSALEKEVMRRLLEVSEEAERLRAELDRYSHLWQSDRQSVMQEFLTYSRQLGPEEGEVEEAPPTLKDFRREIDSLRKLYTEVTHLDDVIALHGWLQVDRQPFRDSLLSIIQDWSHMYTQHLLDLLKFTRLMFVSSRQNRSDPVSSLLDSSGPEQSKRGTMMRTLQK